MTTTHHLRAAVEESRGIRGQGWLPLGVILLLATALRLAFLGQESFWRDESLTAYFAQQPLADILSGQVQESGHPCGQLVAAHLWISLAGTGDAAMRLLPVLAGVLGVAAIYFCARQFLDLREANLAAALLAVNPLHIHLSQEFRTYTMLFLAAATMLGAAVAFRRTGSLVALAAWIAAAALGMHLHYYAALPAVGLFAWVLATVGGWRWRIRWLAANTAVTLLAAPLIPRLLAAVAPHTGSDAVRVVFTHLAFTPLALLFGRSLAWTPDGIALACAALAGSLVIWAVAAAYGWKTLPYRGALAAAVLTPLVVVLTLTLGFDVLSWDDRKALVVMPPLILVLAHGLGQAPRTVRRLLLAAIVLSSGIAWARYIVEPFRDDWRSTALFLDARLSPQDAILVAPDEESCALRHYLKASNPAQNFGDPIIGFDVDASKFVEYLPKKNSVTTSPPLLLSQAQRIWLVYDSRRIATAELLAQLAERGVTLELLAPAAEFPRHNVAAVYARRAQIDRPAGASVTDRQRPGAIRSPSGEP